MDIGIILSIITFFGFLILGYILLSKLKNLKVEPDTKSFSDLASRITKVGTEMKVRMDETEKKQKEMEKQRIELSKQDMKMFQEGITNINRMFAGTKERGEIGEALLEEILTPFIKANKVIKNLNIDNKNVEFAWKVSSNKYIPIDSKLPDVLELYNKYCEEKDKKKQLELKKNILKKIEARIDDVKKYRNKKNTTDKVIVAIPDAIFELMPEINSEAQKTNIFVAGYHFVVYVASYIEKEYLFIVESGDIGEYKESIDSLLRLIEEIKEKAKTIDKGVIIIKNANDEIKNSSMEAELQKPRTKKIIIKNKIEEKLEE
ncbi:MAG: DNA recombination protein RmuC [Nanoarchaeota archaeon]|nr:DNA recombination protein RmuC [Nanoarchaeota archaeon]